MYKLFPQTKVYCTCLYISHAAIEVMCITSEWYSYGLYIFIMVVDENMNKKEKKKKTL